MPSTIQYFSLITGLIFAILLSIMYLELNWLAIPAQVQRFGCIDGLRGYLALGVFYHHFLCGPRRSSMESGSIQMSFCLIIWERPQSRAFL